MLSKVINFFSTKTVKEKIATGTLSETQIFIYFYLILMFDTIGFVQQWLAIAGKQPTLLDWVNIWGLLIINAIGYIVLFLVNGGSKGHDFLKKFFSFSFTVGYKYAIIFFMCTALLTSQTQGIAAVVILNMLMFDEIQSMTEKYFHQLSGPPKAGVLKGYINADKFDAEIRGWTRYWNDIFSLPDPLDTNLVKALIVSESSFHPDTDIPAKKHGRARGLMQITDSTMTALSNHHGELSNYLKGILEKLPHKWMEIFQHHYLCIIEGC